MKTYYELLSIQEDATEQQILAAYGLALRKHRSAATAQGSGSTSSTELIQNLDRATEILCDPVSRKRYDDFLEHRRASLFSVDQNAQATDSKLVGQSQIDSPVVVSPIRPGYVSTVHNDGERASGDPVLKTGYVARLRRDQKKQSHVLFTVAGAVGGGMGGIAVALAIAYYVLGLDPLGLNDTQWAKVATHEQDESRIEQEEAKASLTSPDVAHGTEIKAPKTNSSLQANATISSQQSRGTNSSKRVAGVYGSELAKYSYEEKHETFMWAFWVGYMQGVIEFAHQDFEIPAGVTLGEISDVTSAYVKSHPEEWHNLASKLMINALAQQWPRTTNEYRQDWIYSGAELAKEVKGQSEAEAKQKSDDLIEILLANDDGFSDGHLLGYISSVIEFRSADLPALPKGVIPKQVIEVVRKHVRETPEEWHLRASDIVFNAVRNAFNHN